ncbi:MAG TPA: hypothetical protein VF646_10250 [Cytophagales bacterium]
MKAIYKTKNNAEERLLVSSSLSHPGTPFRMIRIETSGAGHGPLGDAPGRGQAYEPGSFTKEVHLHAMPLLGLVQGKTASLAEEDTYALFLDDSGRPTAVNVGYHQPVDYRLVDYSQFEKLVSEVDRISFWVTLIRQTSWPLVKFTLYEGYGKGLNHPVFTGYSINRGEPTIGHYRYSTVELARIEKTMFDAGVFTDYLHASVAAGAENLTIPG